MGIVITFIVAGVILLVLETVLPGLIAGILGLLCLAGAVVHAYMSQGAQIGTIVLLCVLALLIVGTFLWLKFFPNSRFGRKFSSESTVGDIHTERPDLMNQLGEALTPLRPSGTAIINGQRVDVVTEGGMIERRAPVRVVAVEGMRVVVRALNP